jgi:hypothetical protein
VHYLRQKLPKFVLHITHIQRGHHLSYVQCTSDIQALPIYAAARERQLFQQQLQFRSSNRRCRPAEAGTQLFTYPHKKKSQDVISGDLAGHEVGPARPLWQMLFRRCRHNHAQADGAPAVLADVDRHSFPAYPGKCWMSQSLRQRKRV